MYNTLLHIHIINYLQNRNAVRYKTTGRKRELSVTSEIPSVNKRILLLTK